MDPISGGLAGAGILTSLIGGLTQKDSQADAIDAAIRAYNRRSKKALRLLDGLGAQEKQDILANAEAQKSGATQSLTDRGLTGTTIQDSSLAGIDRDKLAALARLNDSIRQQKAGVITGQANQVLGAQVGGARSGTGIDYSQFASMGALLGNALSKNSAPPSSGGSYPTLSPDGSEYGAPGSPWGPTASAPTPPSAPQSSYRRLATLIPKRPSKGWRVPYQTLKPLSA